jgi:DnaJ-class molecular chaperone
MIKKLLIALFHKIFGYSCPDCMGNYFKSKECETCLGTGRVFIEEYTCSNGTVYSIKGIDEKK